MSIPIPFSSGNDKTGAFNTAGSFLRRHAWKITFMLLLALAVVALAVQWWLGPQVAAETVARRDFVQTIVASGRVQAPVAEQALRQAETNLDNAKSQLRRNEELFQKGFIGQAALDDSHKAVDLADAQVRSTRKHLETLRSTGSDFALAEAALAQAQASAQAARARAGYAAITAPADGTLIARNVEVGDVVQPGKVLMTLSPTGRTQLVVDIDEKNLRLLATGQKALAMNPALLLADEPTANLHTKSADGVFDLLRRFNREHGTTVLFVTHNAALADRCDKIIRVVDGHLTG
jgi:biotin carboxyl carrier protein